MGREGKKEKNGGVAKPWDKKDEAKGSRAGMTEKGFLVVKGGGSGMKTKPCEGKKS